MSPHHAIHEQPPSDGLLRLSAAAAAAVAAAAIAIAVAAGICCFGRQLQRHAIRVHVSRLCRRKLEDCAAGVFKSLSHLWEETTARVKRTAMQSNLLKLSAQSTPSIEKTGLQ